MECVIEVERDEYGFGYDPKCHLIFGRKIVILFDKIPDQTNYRCI